MLRLPLQERQIELDLRASSRCTSFIMMEGSVSAFFSLDDEVTQNSIVKFERMLELFQSFLVALNVHANVVGFSQACRSCKPSDDDPSLPYDEFCRH